MAATTRLKGPRQDADDDAVRRRILDAAFATFMERGYAQTSTLQIATRAQVSKRALYALVGNKQQMLAACIGARAGRLQVRADLAEPRDRKTVAQALTALGTQLLRETSDPAVIAMFRLAIAEAVRAPEVAQTLDSVGAETSRAALRQFMSRALSSGILAGNPAEMAERFAGMLWGGLLLRLLLGTAGRPGVAETARRARDAAAAFLRLYQRPGDGG